LERSGAGGKSGERERSGSGRATERERSGERVSQKEAWAMSGKSAAHAPLTSSVGRTVAKCRSWVLVKCVWCGAYYWFRLRKRTGYGFHAFLTCISLL